MSPEDLRIDTALCFGERKHRHLSDNRAISAGYANAIADTIHLPPAHWLSNRIGREPFRLRPERGAGQVGPDSMVPAQAHACGRCWQPSRLSISLHHHEGSDWLLRAIPGVGPLGATALAAVLGEDARGYRNAREFAACLGLVPRHTGTGGKVSVGRLSKRGDPYLRTLLMHGARAVIHHAKDKNPWLQQMLARRPLNVVVAALANKMARTAWALVAHGREYKVGGMARAA